MSTSVDARRRPSLWSYISFGSPRRRSVSLPQTNAASTSSYSNGKSIFESSGYTSSRESSASLKDASMTGGQRARLFKIGGVFAFAFFLFYLFSSKDGASVREIVKGTVHNLYAGLTSLTISTSWSQIQRGSESGWAHKHGEDTIQSIADEQMYQIIFER